MSDIKLIWDGARADFGLLQDTVATGAAHLELVSGQASTPSNAALEGLGRLVDLRAHIALTSWTGSDVSVLDKLDSEHNCQFGFGVLSNGRLWVRISPDGNIPSALSSTAAVSASAGAAKWIRVTFDLSASSVATFFTSDDGLSWDQLGSTVAIPPTEMFPGPTDLYIGSGRGAGGQLVGDVFHAEVRNGIGGPVVAKFTPSTHAGETSFESPTGETWTVSGSSASIEMDDPETLPPRDLEPEDGLETAVILSLFTDRRAPEGATLPDESGDRRGWWGDALPVVDGDEVGSLLWLLQRSKQTPAVLAQVEQYARESLAWMVEDKVASAVDVVASNPRSGMWGLEVTISRPKLSPVTYRYDSAWAAQAGRG